MAKRLIFFSRLNIIVFVLALVAVIHRMDSSALGQDVRTLDLMKSAITATQYERSLSLGVFHDAALTWLQQQEEELGVNVLHAWGMTKMSLLGTVSRLTSKHDDLTSQAQWDAKAKQGYPLAGVELRIVDEVEKELPWDGETMGELQVRGPWIISQYFKRPVSGEYMTKDGWFRTGDVVIIDPNGFMTITDRTKDLVKSGGEWISTVELESVIMDHPQVLEAAVIAIPDARWAERPLACVVPTEDGDDLTAEDLTAYLSDKVAKFWIPDQFVFIGEVPKTSVGKFSQRILSEQYAAGELG